MYILPLLLLVGAVSALPAATQDQSSSDVAAIMAVPESSFTSYQTGGLIRQPVDQDGEVTKRAWKCTPKPIRTSGDKDTGGKGITITNDGKASRGFYIYHNSCDSVPWKYIWIDAGKTQFVSFPDGFEGRIQRGVDKFMLNGQPQTLGTWFEVSWDQHGVGWADVSLIRGCDGAVLIRSLDNSGAWKGFTQWILDGAPAGAYNKKSDGQSVIKETEGRNAAINTIPRDWDLKKVGAQYAYVDDSHGSPVIASQNGRFSTHWPEGRA
ncbi:hypothetical protein PT974_11131 [Cladobotryum mycophilum]|uniref:Uncharacterized protein n=1 Tax=Cladobotryum mycophilum TaxID=491253 RepID=A0ABR0S5B9_9HYPO